jgi:hypothetical protein
MLQSVSDRTGLHAHKSYRTPTYSFGLIVSDRGLHVVGTGRSRDLVDGVIHECLFQWPTSVIVSLNERTLQDWTPIPSILFDMAVSPISHQSFTLIKYSFFSWCEQEGVTPTHQYYSCANNWDALQIYFHVSIIWLKNLNRKRKMNKTLFSFDNILWRPYTLALSCFNRRGKDWKDFCIQILPTPQLVLARARN